MARPGCRPEPNCRQHNVCVYLRGNPGNLPSRRELTAFQWHKQPCRPSNPLTAHSMCSDFFQLGFSSGVILSPLGSPSGAEALERFNLESNVEAKRIGPGTAGGATSAYDTLRVEESRPKCRKTPATSSAKAKAAKVPKAKAQSSRMKRPAARNGQD